MQNPNAEGGVLEDQCVRSPWNTQCVVYLEVSLVVLLHHQAHSHLPIVGS